MGDGGVSAGPLEAFSTELAVDAPESVAAPEPAAGRGRSRAWPAAGLVVALLAASGIAAYHLRRPAAPPAPQTGTVTVDTEPPGVNVAIVGRPRGAAPVALSLPPGSHVLTLINKGDQRTITVKVVAGQQLSEHFEFAANPLPQTVGTLSVTADVPSRVAIDGRPVGAAPIAVSNLAAGDHVVSVTSDTGTVTRKVAVSPGTTASAAFSFAVARASGPAAGWMTFSVPFAVQVFEGKDLIGSSGEKVMAAAGHHDVRLVNDALGYAETRSVDVAAGKVSTIKVDPPHTTLNVNARPWADVSIDGVDVGQTPLANVSVAVGAHEVVFRHPQLGEQRRTVTATEKGPNRISADMTANSSRH